MKSGAGLEERFQQHPAARIFGAHGEVVKPERDMAAVIPDRPGAAALDAALAACALDLPFRIGGGGDLPARGAVPMFETLTSGSSGAPRRIWRSQRSWTASFAVNAGLFGIGPGRRVAVPGRMVQSLALYGALEALHLGAELHLLDGLRPDRQVAALVQRRVEVVYATPAQLRLMLDAGGGPVPSLRLLLVGGSKLDPKARAGLTVLFPHADIREFYGTAEASFITLSDASTPEGSVGLPYPGVEINLRGPAGAHAIWVRSPYLFKGYTGDPGNAIWQDGWLSVGEIGRQEDGYLYLSGRAGRMVTVADHNVFPEEIEAFLLTLPGITRAAALARPDPLRGHVIEAVVAGGVDTATLAACRAHFGPLKAPRRLHRIAEWPLLGSGKTDLAALERAFLWPPS